MRSTLKHQVEEILKEFPETRNSDITLMIKLWEVYYPKYVRKGASGEMGVWLKDLYELPQEDNVKRVRAIFQNDLNQYLPDDPQVRKQRKVNEEKWLDFVRVQTEWKRK